MLMGVSNWGYVSITAVLRTSDTPYYWVAVKGLNLSYYIGETLLFTIYSHYGNLF